MTRNSLARIAISILLLLVGGTIGIQLGERHATMSTTPPAAREVLYYRNPMGLSDTSPEPKKDNMGMDYIPVYADAASEPASRKVLYYRNPMGLADISPVPKKDSMGMDYIPVFEGEETAAGLVRLTQDKVQKLGVVTESVQARVIQRPVRAVGVIETNERTLTTVAPRFEGWIEKLYANETGGAVQRGNALFSAYSPELVAAQQEYLLALEARQSGSGELSETLLGMARERLRNWQVSESEIRNLESRGTPQRAMTFRSPIDGVVLEKNATEGARFMPGDALFLLADLRVVWMIASVYEEELETLELGQPVTLAVDAFPGKTFSGAISFIYPTLSTETRTAKIRIEFSNTELRLRPGMYGQIDVQSSPNAEPVVSVSDSAILESGKRSIALVEIAQGLFEPREVNVGRRGETFVEIREGLALGERVVVSANFLIDAESNLKAALNAFDRGSESVPAPRGDGPAATESGAPQPDAAQGTADEHATHDSHPQAEEEQ